MKMSKYELMVVIDPFLEEADTQALIEKGQELVKRFEGTILNVDTWGKRRLAYPINKKLEGFYVLYTFEGELEGAAIAELERNLRLDEKVMRHMVTRIPVIKPRKVRTKKNDGDTSRSSETISAGQAGQNPQR